MNTAVAHPQANGLVEKANQSLMEGIKTRLGREKAGWVDELPNVLWAHRTSIKQINGEAPFSLTYRSEREWLLQVANNGGQVNVIARTPKFQWVEQFSDE
ncbi:reverse transcriptase domain-containing protein [Tanacetum coccineum]